MSEYVAMFRIKGLMITGLEVPERLEIDRDFVLERMQKEPESAIAVLRFQTEEETVTFSKEYWNVRLRLERFIHINAVFAGLSARIESLGVSQIDEGLKLEPAKLRHLTLSVNVEYTEEEKKERLRKAYNTIDKSVAKFQSYEKLLYQNRYLVNAVNYFYYAGLASRMEEKAINLAISLEALYLVEKMELSYRLSLRACSLIGNSYSEKSRKQIALEMRDFYDKRSAIVHGDEVKISQEEISQVTDYTRKSLQKFLVLSSKYNKKGILGLIDDSLFNNDVAKFLNEVHD